MNKYILLTGTANCLFIGTASSRAADIDNIEDTNIVGGSGYVSSTPNGENDTMISFTTKQEGQVISSNVAILTNQLKINTDQMRDMQNSVNATSAGVSEVKGKVTEIESTLKTKADDADLTALETRVGTTEENLKLKADNSTVTALDTRVKTAENDIDALEAEQDEQDTKINNITSGTTYTGTGLETAVRNTATSVFDTSLDTAIASGGRIYNFTNQQITNAVERNGAIYNFTYDTLEAEVGDRRRLIRH